MIDPQQWQSIKQVLQEALTLEHDQWPHFLDQACGDDTALREQVESLLSHHDDAQFMSVPALSDLPSEPSIIGTTIGRYRVIRALGAGGMGEVFEAEQLEPFVRTVAIKLLRRGVYSRELTERFDSEHRALAMMNHLNIAQVFDADWTTDERPYFVMEYVPGESITEACSGRTLDLRQRIELFLQVCDGVQHAHRKGIIHRDLKPSNVLVSGKGQQLIAKIIDFGVAKGARAIVRSAQPSGDEPMVGHTQIGAWIGTSGYVSPEQALGDADIDTRSDIYSLGALLYELLALRPAYADDELQDASREQRLRIICEDMPPPPSERVSSPGAARSLRGDLDQVVLKAMAKQPNARYSTVTELSADLRRHLQHEPVDAVNGGLFYRFAKLLRRRTLSVALGALAATVLLAGTLATGLGYLQAVRAEKAAALEAQRANTEAQKASQTADFLASLFRVSDPTQGVGSKISAREILERGAGRVNREFDQQPATRAMLLDTIGVVYTNLGLYDEAGRYLTQAQALRDSLYGEQHVDTAASFNHLGKLHYFNGQQELARTYYDRALSINRSLLGDDDIAVAESRNNLGELLVAQADFAGAIEQHRQALTIRQRVLGPGHRDVGMSLNNLAGALRRSGDVAAAEATYRRAIDVNRRALGEVNSEVATNLSNLGVFLMSVGKYEEAFALHTEALQIRRLTLDANHPHIANSLHNVGSLYVHLGRYQQGEPLVQESLTMHIELHGEQHPLVALTRNNLGVVWENQGRLDDALEQYMQALAVFRETVGMAHPYYAITQTNRARVLVARGEFVEAEKISADAATALAAAIAPDHWRVAVANSVRGAALLGLGRIEETEPLLVQSERVIVAAQGEDTPYSRRARQRLKALAAAQQ